MHVGAALQKDLVEDQGYQVWNWLGGSWGWRGTLETEGVPYFYIARHCQSCTIEVFADLGSCLAMS